VEATVRWRHPDLGILEAERFLPAVEAMGWGDRLFETVLAQTLRAQAGWEAETGQRPRVSVNISSLQLGTAGIVDVVLRALAERDTPPDTLSVEVTGTGPLDDVAVAVLRQLHALGVHLVLDGFGTGSASLERLARLPWDMLMIGRALVAELGEDPATTAMVRAMVAMAHALDISAAAEGVTRMSQLELIADLGCAVAQGPLFSRPEPADELRRMLESGRVWVGDDFVRRAVAQELAADR
jgi:EAL domain-containing protein (putative c-di-GMP-specific phosphodiesterase class I)